MSAEEKRQHPRVTVPLIVELSHATLGTVETTAKDLSDGGVYIQLTGHTLQAGAALKIRLKSSTLTDTQHTPTVEAEVVRVEADGIAVAFKNKTAHHLWSSVERLRGELSIGKDYFQVYEAIVCRHRDRGVLFAQRHGKWGFPGFFLEVAEDPAQRREQFLHANLQLEPYECTGPVAVENFHNPMLPEASTMCVVQRLTTEFPKVVIPEHSDFKDYKWVCRAKDLADLTVASEWMRPIASQELVEMGLIDA